MLLNYFNTKLLTLPSFQMMANIIHTFTTFPSLISVSTWWEQTLQQLRILWQSGTDMTKQAGEQINQQLSANTIEVAQYVPQLDMAGLLALAAALGWASGMRLYLVVFLTGAMGYLHLFALPEGLQILQHPLMLSVSFALLFVEFFVDKIPGLDSIWDAINSFIRIPAGAALAAGVFGADNATMSAAVGLLGGTLAATSFATKATARAALNTSPEPFSNIAMSFFEEGVIIGAMWLATNHPLIFGVFLVLALILMVTVLTVLWRFLRIVYKRIKTMLNTNHTTSKPPSLPLA